MVCIGVSLTVIVLVYQVHCLCFTLDLKLTALNCISNEFEIKFHIVIVTRSTTESNYYLVYCKEYGELKFNGYQFGGLYGGQST